MRKEWIKYTEETTRWSKNETDQIFLFFSFFSFGLLGFFSVFKFFVRHFFTREDGNRGRARAVKSGSTELREIRTAGVLFFFFRREGGGDDDDDDFELFEKFARSFLEEKRSLAEGVFTSAFVSLLTMCLCRPWRLCFSSLSLSLSFLLSFAHRTPPL